MNKNEGGGRDNDSGGEVELDEMRSEHQAAWKYLSKSEVTALYTRVDFKIVSLL